MNYIAYLHNTPLKREDLGAKAFSLTELWGHALIPKGFVVTAGVFDGFLRQIKRQTEGGGEIQTTNPLSLSQDILSADIPVDIENEITKAIEALGLSCVAVRSSGVDEDGERFSFAGQLETSLGVPVKEIFPHIKKSWASLYSPHLMAYASRSSKGGMPLAVLVQEMIDADISGVGFSCHPVTGGNDVMVIESVIGLGEALVQGAVTPCHYVVRKGDLSVGKIIPGDQEKFLRLGYFEQKICEDDIKYPLENKYELNVVKLKQVAELVLRVEAFYNKPVDIEWAYQGDTLYLLQARPITTLLKP